MHRYMIYTKICTFTRDAVKRDAQLDDIHRRDTLLENMHKISWLKINDMPPPSTLKKNFSSFIIF